MYGNEAMNTLEHELESGRIGVQEYNKNVRRVQDGKHYIPLIEGGTLEVRFSHNIGQPTAVRRPTGA